MLGHPLPLWERVASAASRATIREVSEPTHAEQECLSYHVYRSTRDSALFFIHWRWQDEAAFDEHAALPHTVRFLERVAPLIDHPARCDAGGNCMR